MFRFTIRDVLWLTVVVGLGVTLYQQRTTMYEQRMKIDQQQSQIERQVSELRDQDFRYGRLREVAGKQRVAIDRLEEAQKSPAASPSKQSN